MTIKEIEKLSDDDYIPLKSLHDRFGINKHGKIKNLKFDRPIRTYIGTDCYEHAILHYNGKRYRKRVHRLMAEAFFNNAKYIDHIDNIKSNNDYTNLRPISNRNNVLKGMEDAQKYHGNVGWFKPLKVKSIDRNTGKEKIYRSIRACEKDTGVDRHRIKTFLRQERNNYTNYDFELVTE